MSVIVSETASETYQGTLGDRPTRFEVWAPRAKRMEIEIFGDRRTLQSGREGWWSIDVPEARHGTDYAYRVDGGRPLPDPRSAWQPHGIHGPSRLVDHQRFDWTDAGWQAPPLSSAVIYELHVGTFTPEGTFDGVIGRLDYLRELGVTHVEIMPVAEFGGDRGWGYDGVDLFAPHHAYGGPDGLKRLVDACHAKGLAALLDVVYNHLGPTGNYLPQYGPYFSDRHHTAWGSAVNFDGPWSDEVRRFLCDNAIMWLGDYHFDGLRLDAVHAIVDMSAIPFLEQLATEVEALKAHLGRHLVLIAESDSNDPRVVRPWQMGGYGLDAQWSDDVHHALHASLTGEKEGYYADFGSMADLALAMKRPFVYAGRHSKFRQRSHGRPPEGLSGNNFVAFLQNHDQLGNRAQGDRIGHLASREAQKLGAALVLLGPYIPLLFQGEEWGATAPFQYFVDFHDEPELARAVTEGRRKEFAAFNWAPEEIPDPQAESTFLRSRLDWSELEKPSHAELVAWHQRLIRFRRQWWELTDGRLDLTETRFDSEACWLQIERGRLLIAANFNHQRQAVPLPRGATALLLASANKIEIHDNQVWLPGMSVAVLQTATVG